MSLINRLKTIINRNKGLVLNVIAAFLIKGFGMVVSLLAMPLYMRYFDDNVVLGVWFTILTVINWILSFDVGIGNGLRNHLTTAIAHNQYEEGRRLISSGCAVLGAITLLFAVAVYSILPFVSLNEMFNISQDVMTPELLQKSIGITVCGILLTFFLHIIRGMLFALQLASVNNFLHLLTNLLLVGFLIVAPREVSMSAKIINISIAYSLIINVPYILAAIYVFGGTILKNCIPSPRFCTKQASKAVLGLGVSFFIVQITYMIITVTNEWFITKFFAPEFCVDYQVYFRVFGLISSLLLLAMSPLWSAITKAYAQKRYSWISKLQTVLYLLALGCIIIQCLFLPIIQPLVNVWLRDRAIIIDMRTAFIFLLYSIVMIWIAIQSSVANGLGKLKTQLWFYLFAAVFKISVIVICSRFTDNWSIVVLATAIGLLPYCIIQPFYINKELKKISNI